MNTLKYKVLSILSVLIILSSCKKTFLDTFPTDAVASADALASVQNAYAALNGIHRIMYVQYDQQGEAGEGSNNIFRDLMGEDIVYPLANGSTGLITWMQWVAHRNVNAVDLKYVYRFYYRLISNANILVNGVDNVPGLEADKKIIKGQAAGIQGHGHIFNLYNYGGKDMTQQRNLTALQAYHCC